jgi:hypothetical protein
MSVVAHRGSILSQPFHGRFKEQQTALGFLGLRFYLSLFHPQKFRQLLRIA